MFNQIILVGRLVEDPVLKEIEEGLELANITLAVQKPYKNAETMEFETDFIPITLWQGIAQNTCEYCVKGSVVGVRGRISMRKRDIGDEKSIQVPEIIGERISFICHPNKK